MDVIDDFVGEASEISKVNSWLCYGEHLHKLREFGVTLKELDMIDERKLTSDQIMTICGMILDIPVEEMPHPDVDFNSFMTLINERQKLLPQIWSPLRRRMASWIDVAQLRWQYGPNFWNALKFRGQSGRLSLSLIFGMLVVVFAGFIAFSL